jgi:Ser/Thr protein kinase RdoA (MazF antagonist)
LLLARARVLKRGGRTATCARRRLRALRGPDGERLCHADFHPGNVLLRRDGGYVVIDWKAAARRDPAGDVARTRLLLPHAWIPGSGRRRLQLLLTPIRRGLYSTYLRAYRRRRRLDPAAIDAWVPVLAAARLSYDIAEERTRMLALARRGLRGGAQGGSVLVWECRVKAKAKARYTGGRSRT